MGAPRRAAVRSNQPRPRSMMPPRGLGTCGGAGRVNVSRQAPPIYTAFWSESHPFLWPGVRQLTLPLPELSLVCLLPVSLLVSGPLHFLQVPPPVNSTHLQIPHLGVILAPLAHRKSVWRRIRVTVATRGSRPVDSACSSILEAAIRVVISVSAATPAPQQLRDKRMVDVDRDVRGQSRA